MWRLKRSLGWKEWNVPLKEGRTLWGLHISAEIHIHYEPRISSYLFSLKVGERKGDDLHLDVHGEVVLIPYRHLPIILKIIPTITGPKRSPVWTRRPASSLRPSIHRLLPPVPIGLQLIPRPDLEHLARTIIAKPVPRRAPLLLAPCGLEFVV